MLSTWPGLRTAIDGAWVWRSARGFSGRANCLIVLDPADEADCAARLDRVERFFRAEGLPPTVRVTALTPPVLTALLDERGYSTDGPTLLLLRDVPNRPGEVVAHPVRRIASDSPRWYGTVAAGTGRAAADGATLMAMVASLAAPHALIVCEAETEADDAAAGALLVAVHAGLATVHSLVTRPDRQRRGVARTLMEAALAFAGEEGAEAMWIAVDEGNAPARALYAGFGFHPVSAYHYRRTPR